jgi:hypothetical protein
MPSNSVRRTKNRQFAEAAAAMGAFWKRARLREAHRIEQLQRQLLASAEVAMGALPRRVAPSRRAESSAPAN